LSHYRDTHFTEMARTFTLATLALCLGSAAAFAPVHFASRSSASSLKAKSDDSTVGANMFARTAIASACLLSGLFAADAAFAAPAPPTQVDFGASTVIAGRSGGRAGGRASAARPSSRSRTVINRTTVVAPPVMVSPGYGYGGYGYGSPGLGLGLTLGAMNSVGDGIREYRQEGEIRDTRSQLEQERMKSFELEQRLRNLEMQQGQMQRAPVAPVAPAPAQ